MDKRMKKEGNDCGYKSGQLPDCAPLALAYVPKQQSGAPQYESEKALARGTLFPGLDLPLKNIVNTAAANVPEAELMALDFAAHDLSLYLDTHPDDREAFSVYKELLKLAEEGRNRYAKLCGAVDKCSLADSGSYTWVKGPWPWDYVREG